MWGRVILGAVIVTLTILWLVAIWFLFLDERTFLQKWQRGLWNSANWPMRTVMQNVLATEPAIRTFGLPRHQVSLLATR
jgi:hypothetical protein